VVDEVDRVRNAIVSAHVPVCMSLTVNRAVGHFTESLLLLTLLLDGSEALLAQEHVFGLEAEVATLHFRLIDSEAQTALIFIRHLGQGGTSAAHLLPQREEIGGFSDTTWRHSRRQLHVASRFATWRDETLICSLSVGPILEVIFTGIHGRL